MKFLLAIPAYNEEDIIQKTMVSLNFFLRKNFVESEYLVVIADNASTDSTRKKVEDFLPELKNFRYLFVPQKGKGGAIKSAWESGGGAFDSYIFMDADLATDLEALPGMIGELGSNDLVIGDRYHKGSIVERIKRRKIVSFIYRSLMRFVLKSKISDFPCGFKGITAEVFRDIVPMVENKSWFFDSELVYLAEFKGKKIKEIPVRWRDPRSKAVQSRVKILTVARQYVAEMVRLRARTRKQAD